MSELINIWREIGAYNRFAETKLAFFIGLTLAIIGLESTPTTASLDAVTLLKGGNALIMTFAASTCLVSCALAILPQLRSVRILDSLIPKTDSQNLYYFLSIANFSDSRTWLDSTNIRLPDDERPRAAMLAEQIHILAKIAARKFGILRYSIFLIAISWLVSWLYAWWQH